MNRFLSLLGIRLPIIQAPMAGVSTPEMAAAVSEAGGLGSIGVGSSDAASARAMIKAIRARTQRPFNVNVFCHAPAHADPAKEAAWLAHFAPHFARLGAKPPEGLRTIYRSFIENDEMLAMFLAERPAVVSFHFGLPTAERVQQLKAAGIRLLATATNLAEGRVLSEAGIDAVVAQGFEAGGHRGVFDPNAPDEMLGTMALTRLLATNLSIPVIAAGGIMDGAGIAAALALGAEAAQLGTAFILCPESAADAGYRQALRERPARPTVMTRAISGRPARSISNQLTNLCEAIAPERIPSYPIAYDAAKTLHTAAKAAGEFGYGAQWAGQGVGLARQQPAGELVALLWQECREAISQLNHDFTSLG
jgi:nitronate monooxygenase